MRASMFRITSLLVAAVAVASPVLATAPVSTVAALAIAQTGLPGDDDADPASDCVALTLNLRYRSRDAMTSGEVSLLQDFLNLHGYLSVEANGFFGLSTFKAVKAFQKDNGLRPTGFVGVLTRSRIQAMSCGTTEDIPTKPVSSVSAILWTDRKEYAVGSTVLFTAKVVESDGTPFTPAEGASVGVTQVSASGRIHDQDRMMYNDQNGYYELRTDDHTGAADVGSWTAFVTAYRSGVSVATSEKVTYRVTGERQSVTVLSPNGGESWIVGGTYKIAYRIHGIDIGENNPVMIYLERYNNPPSKPGPNSTILIGTTKNEESFSYTVPPEILEWPGEGSDYRVKVCTKREYCGVYDESDGTFSISAGSGTNRPPVIDGVGAPVSLLVNAQGTWTVHAHDPENQPLSYAISWGDEVRTYNKVSRFSAEAFVQTATFSHAYATAGKYVVKITVKDALGNTASTSVTVVVTQEGGIVPLPLLERRDD